MKKKKCVVLLSGGLDSTTVLALAKTEFDVESLSFHYGQRHEVELEAARKVAHAYGARHTTMSIDPTVFLGTPLTTSTMPVPRSRIDRAGGEVAPTFVPMRNAVFLALGGAFAESIGSRDVFIGVNARDYSGYPDCRPKFIAAFETMANLALSGGPRFSIHAPLMFMSKAEIIQLGLNLGVDYGLTSTCYDPDPDGSPCRECDACHLRAKGFKEAGATDPLLDGEG